MQVFVCIESRLLRRAYSPDVVVPNTERQVEANKNYKYLSCSSLLWSPSGISQSSTGSSSSSEITKTGYIWLDMKKMKPSEQVVCHITRQA